MARSVWKGPFVDGYLLNKADAARASGRNEIIKIWSRRSTILPQFVGLTFGVYGHTQVEDGILQADVFRGTVVELPEAETQRRKSATNPEWPIAHVVLHGVTRDQFMARHKANHAQVVYAPGADTADRALTAKAAMFAKLGVRVHLIGDTPLV